MRALRLKGPIHLACSTVDCFKCQRQTPVFAIEASDLKDFNVAPDPTPLGQAVFVHGVEGLLPAVLREGLTQHASNFRQVSSRTAGTTYWGNECIHCGALQGDFFLHSEPDGPFFAGPEDFDGQRVLLTEKNIALASGFYAY